MNRNTNSKLFNSKGGTRLQVVHRREMSKISRLQCDVKQNIYRTSQFQNALQI